MNIGICDDDLIQLKLLNSFCLNWSKINNIDVKIYTFISAESFLFQYEDNLSLDVLLLDIQMKELTGIDLAKKLRNMKNDVGIIFITGLKEHVFEGYHVQAIDYLMKPVKEELLFNALSRSYENLSCVDKFVLVEENNQIVKLKEKNIVYAESSSHSTLLYTSDKIFRSNKGISYYEKELSTDLFYRCHRCYLINILKIESISKSQVELENNIIIPISRGKWENLNKSFLDFYRSRL